MFSKVAEKSPALYKSEEICLKKIVFCSWIPIRGKMTRNRGGGSGPTPPEKTVMKERKGACARQKQWGQVSKKSNRLERAAAATTTVLHNFFLVNIRWQWRAKYHRKTTSGQLVFKNVPVYKTIQYVGSQGTRMENASAKNGEISCFPACEADSDHF